MPAFRHNPTGLCFMMPFKNGFSLFKNAKDKEGKNLFSFSWGNYLPDRRPFDGMLVRDPVERFISGFRNKVRYHSRPWAEAASKWACMMAGVPVDDIRMIQVSDLLAAIEKLVKRGRSDAGWDFHFLPQVWQGNFDYIEQLYDIRYDHDLLDLLGVDYSCKANRTDHFPLEVSNEEREWIASLYAMDVEFYNRYREFREKRRSERFVIESILQPYLF